MAASPTRGIEHIGITVPDIAAATSFFVNALDAELIYDMFDLSPFPDIKGDPTEGVDFAAILGVKPGTRMKAFRMLRLRNGPNLEIFEFSSSSQQPTPRPEDFGFQHVGILVDDIQSVASRIEAAGGKKLMGPVPMLLHEAGEGNFFWYFRTPWGLTLELLVVRSPQDYEKRTSVKRWKPV